jgi:predicted amidohydrolase YtcJ
MIRENHRMKNLKLKRIFAGLLSFFISQIAVFAQAADLVIVNANVRTIDKTRPRAEAVAVTRNRIAAVGTNQEIRRLAGSGTVIIDAGGRLVLPGFNDAHVHFAGVGGQFFSIDLRAVKTPAEMVEKIKFYVRFLPPGQWILGGGWNHENWTPGELPAKELIDAATSAHPVFIYHANGKMALVNSLALKLAGLDAKAKAVAGGEIVRNPAGDPTGVLKDSAMNPVKRLVPPAATTEGKLAVAEAATNFAAAFGVTSVQDMSADDQAEIYRELARQGKLKTRIYDCIALSEWSKLAKSGVKKASGDALVRRGCLKGVADGDPDSTAKLFEETLAADRADLQVMVHAIGRRANGQILSVFERVVKTNGPKDRRPRVEHAHAFSPADLRRFGNSAIIASVQPFLFADDAGKSFEPLRALLAGNAPLAFGSDASLIPLNPLFGIAAAVGTNDPKQKLTVEEAVRLYTSGAAFAEFQENEKGTIAVGKLADFVILSDDIFTINPGKISQTKILTTVMDGRIVYRAD